MYGLCGVYIYVTNSKRKFDTVNSILNKINEGGGKLLLNDSLFSVVRKFVIVRNNIKMYSI